MILDAINQLGTAARTASSRLRMDVELALGEDEWAAFMRELEPYMKYSSVTDSSDYILFSGVRVRRGCMFSPQNSP